MTLTLAACSTLFAAASLILHFQLPRKSVSCLSVQIIKVQDLTYLLAPAPSNSQSLIAATSLFLHSGLAQMCVNRSSDEQKALQMSHNQRQDFECFFSLTISPVHFEIQTTSRLETFVRPHTIFLSSAICCTLPHAASLVQYSGEMYYVLALGSCLCIRFGLPKGKGSNQSHIPTFRFENRVLS